jgi:uncharacterized protein with PhoU and TrkA domain
MRDIKQSGINAALNECDRLRALTQQQAEQLNSLLDVYRQNMQLVSEQAEQIAELVEYAKGLREAIRCANYSSALAKPMPKAMKEDS